MDSKLYYTYQQINDIINNTALHIKQTCDVDVILAIGGGGLIPARILRNHIEKPIQVISVKLYSDTDEISNNIEIIQWLNKDLRGKRVLIVDEINDTGTTLDFCVKKLQTENGMDQFSVFVLHDKKREKLKHLEGYQHYFVGEKIEDRWVVYPWDN